MSAYVQRPRDTWAALLSDLDSPLAAHSVTIIPNENTFHHSFAEVCARACEPDSQRLLAKFIRQHERMFAFVGALNEALGLNSLPNLQSLFWSVALATTELALKYKKKSVVYQDNLPKLNAAIPTFGPNLPLFTDVPNVQNPLQRVFREYIECYTIMFTAFASHTAPVSFETFDDRVSEAHAIFKQAKEEWEAMVKMATTSALSYSRGSTGPLHPYAPRDISFEWIETLGHGTYGDVSKVRQTNNGRLYAQKVIRVADPRTRARIAREVQNEVDCMEKLPHQHIASLLFHVQESDKFSIIMLPVADCNLSHFLQKKCIEESFPRTELTQLTHWFGCLVKALSFAHSKSIKHEDIKPTNILIKDNQPYLADFGCAKDFSELENSTSTDVLAIGTPAFWAPENPPRGRAADIFSLGCVFSEMLTVRQRRTLVDYRNFRYAERRDHPYAFRENLNGVYQWLRDLRRNHDPVGDLLIEQTLKMLSRDKNDRPSAREVIRSLRQESDAVFCTVCDS